MVGTAASLTVHSVWDRACDGSRRVGGSGLRGWGGRVVHNDQHVTAALVRGNGAGVQLAADGDLEAEGSWTTPLSAFGPRAKRGRASQASPPFPLLHGITPGIQTPSCGSGEGNLPSFAFLLMDSLWNPLHKAGKSPKKQKLPSKDTAPTAAVKASLIKGASPHWKGWAWLSPRWWRSRPHLQKGWSYQPREQMGSPGSYPPFSFCHPIHLLFSSGNTQIKKYRNKHEARHW